MLTGGEPKRIRNSFTFFVVNAFGGLFLKDGEYTPRGEFLKSEVKDTF